MGTSEITADSSPRFSQVLEMSEQVMCSGFRAYISSYASSRYLFFPPANTFS